jgi:hypothetical protein
MRTSAIVKADPGGNPGACLPAVGVALQVDVLVLQRSPQAFDKDVVEPTTAAVRGDPNIGIAKAAALATKPVTAEALEADQLKAKVGELTIEGELLREKIARLESGRPLAWRRSKR